jgi:hypothetical protein
MYTRHNGVGIYHTYKSDDIESGPRTYWFVTDPYLGENEAFDVRDLPTFVAPSDRAFLTHAIVVALQGAIDAGLLTLTTQEA